MIYLLVILITILLIYSIYREKNLYNPVTILFSIWFVVSLFASLKLYNMIDYSDKSVFIIIVGLLSFFMGYLVNRTKEKDRIEKYDYIDNINWKFIRVLLFLALIPTTMLAIKVFNLLISGVSYSQIRSMYYMYGNSQPLISDGALFTLFNIGVTSILYVGIPFIILCAFNKRIDKISLVLISLLTILFVFATSGRTMLLNVIIFVVLLFIVYFKKISKKYKFRCMICLLIMVIIAVVITIIRKSDNAIPNIYSYFAVPIPLFSKMLESKVMNINLYGYSTFYGAYLIIQKIFVILFNYKFANAEYLFSIMDLPSTSWVGVFGSSSDLYNAFVTMFYNLYLDFGIIGVAGIMFIYGFTVTSIYRKSILSMRKMLLYCLLALGLIFSFERFQFSSMPIYIALFLIPLFIKQKKIKKCKKTNRVLVFGMTQTVGGVEAVIMNYYRKMDKDKIQFDFLCNTETVAYEDEIEKLGGKIYKIPSRSKKIIKYYKALNNFYKENAGKYDIIWVNVCSLANIDYLIFAKKYGIKCRIIHSHNSKNMDSKIRGIIHKFNKLIIRNYATDFWACSSEAANWFYMNKKVKKNVIIINNAIDSKIFRFDKKTRDFYRKKMNIDNKFVIGHVGRFHFQKNQLFMIDVFNVIHRKNPDSILILIGEGEDEQKILNKIDSLGLSESIILLGTRNDVNKLMCAMDVFLFPSVFEGLGIVLIEAQAVGLPVVSSSDNIPATVNMAKNFKFLSLGDSIDDWAESVLSMSKVKRNIDNNLLAKNNYDINIEAKKLENFFLLNMKGSVK